MKRTLATTLATVLMSTAILGAVSAVAPSSASAAAGDTTLVTHHPPLTCTTTWSFTDRWGHKGTFRCKTRIMEINWFGQGRIEYFGIAPNRTIWHSWASSGWVVMPNNGLADEVDGAMAREPHYRTVAVWAGGNLWCSTDYGYGYSWNPWHRCDLNNYI